MNLLLLIAMMGIGAAGCAQPSTQAVNTTSRQQEISKEKSHRAADSAFPDYVLRTLDYVRENGRSPDGYVGGRHFGNFERRLPERDLQGRAIKYREWDVKPKRAGVNRGPERLVTGSDGSAWYTRDHYDSFERIE
ncbi:MAG TPA: ribonuclease domain-containing protein [Planctomycetota bacterium]|nr:ribonuclease domain-containing protein [Planctomycetota bacterium]